MSKYDKAGLAMIPSGYKDSKVYSLIPNSSDGDFDFTRGSIATRVNKDGLIDTVASGVPRLEYPLIDGVVQECPSLLLEPQRLQLIQYSNEFSNSAWIKSSTGIDTSIGTNGINPNVAISPDGTQNADRVNFILQSDLDSGMFDIFAASQNNSYSTSVYLKGEGDNVGKKISIRVKRLSGGTFTSVDTNYTLTEEWFRLEINPLTLPSGATNGIVSISSSEATSCLIFGIQVEEGSYSTSYIKNEGNSSGVTRAAETCDGAGTSAEFNDSEGVLFAEIAALDDDGGTLRWINLNNGATNHRVAFYYRTDENQLTYLVSSSSTQVFQTVNLTSASTYIKVAAKYKENDFALWINGFELATVPSGNAPIGLNQLSFDNAVGGDNFYGKTKQLITFKEALTDSDLEDLTSWDSFNEMATGQLYTIE